MKIDITTIVGLLVAIGGIGLGYVLEGGNFAALLAPSPLLIIFGGTFGVTIITQTGTTLKQLPKVLKIIFTVKTYDYLKLVDDLCNWADISRREGFVKLDEKRKEIDDKFIQRGLKLVVDNNEPEHVKEFLENEVYMIEQRHKANQKIWSTAGGFAPTMGIIGTVLGLVVILGNLGGASIGELGHGISVAFIATLLGVSSANIFYLPFEGKLKSKDADEMLYLEIAMQGILAIQSQESPIILRQRLLSMLPEYIRVNAEKKKKEGE